MPESRFPIIHDSQRVNTTIGHDLLIRISGSSQEMQVDLNTQCGIMKALGRVGPRKCQQKL